ncbi:cytochrome c-type biogenesis protein CcmH [Sphaerotilus hippei]|uniref:Cytochrome c-type biogenesis protein n=1 Tax=Sphaerotilus hippei TaxID=744406 RepID=A0A318GV98_9BURK|nr:cytochrome c-type biogenesis protein [Sphaerotilus hippei]PXW93379.1 cytochrome c-type biogenesis protein CcmH [Sphaerotilus hippei]
MSRATAIRHRILTVLLPALLLAGPPGGPPAHAAATPQGVVDPDRLHALTAELRCLVCQNESLADSTAPLALDLKREISARMAAGDSDAQILDFLVERYGDFVTYRPPLAPRTLVLWLGPLVLLLAGAVVVLRPSRRTTAGRRPPSTPSSAPDPSSSTSSTPPP